MIAKTLRLIEAKLSEFYTFIDDVDPNMAVLSTMISQDGSPIVDSQDKVVMSVVNIQNETVMSTYKRYDTNSKDGSLSLISPPQYINLFILFTANFEGSRDKYFEALKFISYTISFFQQNNYFNKENLPGLDEQIDKLAFEMVDLDAQQEGHLFGMLGVKYLPSICYKVRLFPYQDNTVKAKLPKVKG